MLAIGLVPTLIVSALAYATISNELLTKTEDQIGNVATSQQQKITALLQQRQEDSTLLANRFDLQTALADFNSGNKNAQAEINAIILNTQVASSEIQAISVIGLDGTVIAATLSGEQGTQLPESGYYVPTGQDSNISVKEDSKDGIDKLHITIKLYVNKIEAGYLNTVFRIDDITAAIQDYTGLDSTGETVIAAKDDSGNEVSLFPLRFDTDAALKTNLNSLNLVTTDLSTYSQATDYRDQEVLLTTRSVGFADWILATKIDINEAFSPIDQLRTKLFAIVGVSSLIIIALSLFFTQFFIGPILKIVEVSRSFGRGEFSSRVSFSGSDEIGVLGASINSMGAHLQDTISGLEAQRNRLSIILNSINESILAVDSRGTIILANAATGELTRLPERNVVNRNVNEIFRFNKNMHAYQIDYTRDGTNTYPDLEYTDSLGTLHYVKLIVAHASGGGSTSLAAPQTIITIHDETRSKELENMKVDFVSMAAHELRTPLAATRGYLELMSFKEKDKTSSETQTYLHQALKSTSELGSLIDNLLGVTRIERGTLTLQPDKVDIAEDIQQAIKNFSFAASDKRVVITYDGPISGCYIFADQIAMHEVINNLLNNAIKYTNPSGSVNILLGREGNKYILSFRDTGIGIPKKSLQNLFTKFYRVKGGLNSGSTGTGLGLFIAKSIIERHGGTIDVESEEGVGSTFTITMPVFDQKQFDEIKKTMQPKKTLSKGNRGWTTKNIAR